VHIPDGFLTGEAAAIGWAAGGAGLALCLRRVGAESRERDLPVAGLAAAFFLVGDAPLFPVTLGTQGHLLGGMLACALLGPWLGAVTIAVVCVIQALALGDGGITTLGLGIVNLALVPAFVGYPLLVAARRALGLEARGLCVAAGVTAWLSVVLAACLFTAEFAVGHAVPIALHGIAASTIGAYAVIGIVEGTVTAIILRTLMAVRPDLVRVAGPLRRERAARATAALRAAAERGPT
jgi:cobalt/nickel transport system permease protein